MKFRIALLVLLFVPDVLSAGTKTWDGRHATDTIELTIVYFVPQDRTPLPDWQDRVEYFRRRLELFHLREFQGQSILKASVHPDPLVSERSTDDLRQGDANAIFYKTLRECDRRLEFAQKEGERTEFPILLVLSEINWRPLDDFYRVSPFKGEMRFEGNYNRGEHFPGATSGGARATYMAQRGVGWGLVSADGWRVPYRGSDCVVYHEGCGHTVGLPHPEPGNASVMSLGQYNGWISESWLDADQKARLGWAPDEKFTPDNELELFSKFRALPKPKIPTPGEEVRLALDWPDDAKLKSLRLRFQTSVDGPWIDVPVSLGDSAPNEITLGRFDRATPVSYRVDAALENGASSQVWGYFQVRAERNQGPQPLLPPADFALGEVPAEAALVTERPTNEVDLLALVDPSKNWSNGQWSLVDGKLESPKMFGARIELPYEPPAEYRLTAIVEPLDKPNGLLFGNRLGENRFVTLFNYTPQGEGQSAIENIDGRNVGNETTFTGDLFKPERLSQVIVTVKKDRVTMAVDGRTIVNWRGPASDLSLGDYWKTPNAQALFLGAYDCRYRFHRLTLEPLSGEGKVVETPGDAATEPSAK